MPLHLNRDILHKGVYKSDKTYAVKVKLLDNTIVNIRLPSKSRGKDFLEKVAQSLELVETNYFGLQFINKKQQIRWIELNKTLKKQLERNALNNGKDDILIFKVHFFASDCKTLKQEITRYLYYLQLKNDIIEERLKCKDDIAFKLASFAVQSEFGNFDEEKHTLDFIEDFVLLPKRVARNYTSQEINEKISRLHQNNCEMLPSTAELAYITLCQQIDGYGVETFSAKDKDNCELDIGASFMGIKIKPSSSLPVVYFRWQNIANMTFDRQYFCIESLTTEEKIQFETSDSETAKFIWRQCVAQHQFFRMAHGTVGSPTFKTQHEISTDSNIISRSHEEKPFQRRLTLTLKEGREKRQRTSSLVGGSKFGICNAAFNGTDNGDEADAGGEHSIANYPRLSARSNTSNGYNTSESGSDVSGSMRIQPMANAPAYSTQTYPAGSMSPGMNTLKRKTIETRDLMLKQLEKVIDDDEVYVEFEQVFIKKLNCNLTTASLLDNATKNRNREILPYEENRVVLNPSNNEDKNDYINASHIKMDVGKNSNISFIAAQIPLESSSNDFWQMIWEQNVSLCVLISKEESTVDNKGVQYWPDATSIKNTRFGNYSIELQFVNESSYCITRAFKLRRSGETKDVYQMQYNDWPVSGVPEGIAVFVGFLEEVRSMKKSLKGLSESSVDPTVLVHCSNGSGKSGVYILCETLIKQIENNQTFDVPVTLARLRTQRMYLVETVAQFRFVYLVLIHYLKRNRLI
eukprot:gene17361-19097_t